MPEVLKVFVIILFVCMFWIELFQTGPSWRHIAYILIITLALTM